MKKKMLSIKIKGRSFQPARSAKVNASKACQRETSKACQYEQYSRSYSKNNHTFYCIFPSKPSVFGFLGKIVLVILLFHIMFCNNIFQDLRKIILSPSVSYTLKSPSLSFSCSSSSSFSKNKLSNNDFILTRRR